MLGYDPDRVEVLLYQLVHLTKGGAQAKMSKRRGDVVFLRQAESTWHPDTARIEAETLHGIWLDTGVRIVILGPAMAPVDLAPRRKPFARSGATPRWLRR